ncbi:MAG TPA: vWA domain-containing protein [Gaiellaceae bacterium]|nr:vWA domain-containing protein [Gaiellaceae bacterium]
MMKAIQYTGTRALEGSAGRTRLVRSAIGVTAAALVLAAGLSLLHPKADQQPILAPQSGGIVVLDLSASITQDTYSRINETIRQLVARGGRYGLVVFSNDAYEALPPGTPASALAPLARYFAVPAHVPVGRQVTFAVNPWSATFTSGTEISRGLDLARTIELQSHTRHPAVVLISDLADDPNDLQRLNTVLNEYRVEGMRLRIIALNPAPSDVARFKGMIGRASSIIPAGLASTNAAVGAPATSFPTLCVLLVVAAAALIAAYELWAARLSWGEVA